MSTILNALKKAKTDREKTGEGSAAPLGDRPSPPPEEKPRPTPPPGEPARRGSGGGGATRGEGASWRNETPGAGDDLRSRAPAPSPPPGRFPPGPWPSSPPPSQASSVPWIVAVVGILAALAGGGFVYWVVAGRSSGESARADAVQMASMAPTARSTTSPPGADPAGTEDNAEAEAAETRANQGRETEAREPGSREVAMGGKSLVNLDSSASNGGSGGNGSSPPPGSVSQQSIEDYVNEAYGSQKNFGLGAGEASTGIATPTPYVTRTPYPPLEEGANGAAADLPTTTPAPTPSITPRPTPSVPPSPTLFPEGSRVMAADLGLRVEGIMWDETSPSAIINDRIVSNGDVVNEVKILKINRRDIQVEWKGRKLTVEY